MRRLWAWLARAWGAGEAAAIREVREQSEAAYRRAVADTPKVRRAARELADLPAEEFTDRLRRAFSVRHP